MPAKECRSCHTRIPAKASVCPYCFKLQWPALALRALIAVMVLAVAGYAVWQYRSPEVQENQENIAEKPPEETGVSVVNAPVFPIEANTPDGHIPWIPEATGSPEVEPEKSLIQEAPVRKRKEEAKPASPRPQKPDRKTVRKASPKPEKRVEKAQPVKSQSVEDGTVEKARLQADEARPAEGGEASRPKDQPAKVEAGSPQAENSEPRDTAGPVEAQPENTPAAEASEDQAEGTPAAGVSEPQAVNTPAAAAGEPQAVNTTVAGPEGR